jgi:hypothetical protein
MPLSMYNAKDFWNQSTKFPPVWRFQKEFSMQMSSAGNIEMGMGSVDHCVHKKTFNKPVNMESGVLSGEELVEVRPKSLDLKFAFRMSDKARTSREVNEQSD